MKLCVAFFFFFFWVDTVRHAVILHSCVAVVLIRLLHVSVMESCVLVTHNGKVRISPYPPISNLINFSKHYCVQHTRPCLDMEQHQWEDWTDQRSQEARVIVHCHYPYESTLSTQTRSRQYVWGRNQQQQKIPIISIITVPENYMVPCIIRRFVACVDMLDKHRPVWNT